MSARTTNDSLAASLLEGADDQNGTARTAAAEATGQHASPKPRTKRQRPTYDDGAITRIFKFPSKTYPRSSYYVTSTEIIVRIRKARKRWKLVIPKKRTVSYRTNRWFAKPRWIEIELTYPQAEKLGLVEARRLQIETKDDTSAMAATGAAPIAGERSITEFSAPDREQDMIEADQTRFEPDREIDEPDCRNEVSSSACTNQDAQDDTDDGNSQFANASAADTDPCNTSAFQMVLETDPTPEPSETTKTAEPSSAAAAPATDTDTDLGHQSTVPRAALLELTASKRRPMRLALPTADRLGPSSRPAGTRRGPHTKQSTGKIAASLLMSLVGLLATSAVGWVMLIDITEQRISLDTACARHQATGGCTQPLVTGSIARPDLPPAPNWQPAGVSKDVDRAVTEPPEPVTPQAPSTPVQMPMQQADAPRAVIHIEPEVEPQPQPHSETTTETPTATAMPERALELREIVADGTPECDDLLVAARSVTIQFDYASARVDRMTFASLATFARKLQSCAPAMLIIEGHTDSDGDPDRNLALSARRARAVWRALVDLGARPDQLSVIGLGPSRPIASNDAVDAKHRNRRAALVVELPPR